jgi:hypothetical protein
MRLALDRANNGDLVPVPSEVLARFEGNKASPLVGCPLVDHKGVTVAGYEAGYVAGDGPSLRSSWYSLTVLELRHPEKARDEDERAERNRRRRIADRLKGVPFAIAPDGTAWFVLAKNALE